jgi:DNA-binding NarL/FixJ family response regulator
MIRILVGDSHRLYRQALRRLLADFDGIEVVAEASNCCEVVSAVRDHEIDIAVLDPSMPGRDGMELVARIKEMNPALKVLSMSIIGDESYVLRTMRAGSDGFITKEHGAEDLIAVLRQLAHGGVYLCPAIARQLSEAALWRDCDRAPHTHLSDREYKVFEMLVAGKRGFEIANELSLSEKTVSTHKSHVLKKLNLEKSSELVMYAIRHQLVAQ